MNDAMMMIPERLLQQQQYHSSSRRMIALPTMVFALAIVTLFVLAIAACFMRQRRTQEQAASGYRGGGVVDAETLQSIRLQVISIIFPAGVMATTVQKSDDLLLQHDPESNQEKNASSEDTSITISKDDVQQCCDLEAGVVERTDAERLQYDPESVSNAQQDAASSNNTEPSSDCCVMLETDDDNNNDDNNHGEVINRNNDDDNHEISCRNNNNNNNDDSPECSICLEGYKASDEIAIVSQCSHVFHRNCILQWSLKKSQCPICRKHMWSASTFHKLEEDMLAKQVS